MDKKEMMVKAHEMTREIKAEFAEVNYSFQLGLCMAYIAGEGEVEMKNIITIEEVKALAKTEGLEANLWVKNEITRIYLNRYTGAGTKKTSGCFFIAEDGTITVDNTNYTADVKKVWNNISDGVKFAI